MNGLEEALEKCVRLRVIDRSVRDRVLLDLGARASDAKATQDLKPLTKNGWPQVSDSLLSLQKKVQQATEFMKMRNALDQIKIKRREQLTEPSKKQQASAIRTPQKVHHKTASVGCPSDGNFITDWEDLGSPGKTATEERVEDMRLKYDLLVQENNQLSRLDLHGAGAPQPGLTAGELTALSQVRSRHKAQLEKEVAHLSSKLSSLHSLNNSDKFQMMRLQRKLSAKALQRLNTASQFSLEVRRQNLEREAQKHKCNGRANTTAESKLEDVQRLSLEAKQSLQAKLTQLRRENEAIESLLESPIGLDIRNFTLQEADRRRYLNAEIQVLQKALLQKLEAVNQEDQEEEDLADQPPVHRDSRASTLRREFNLQKKSSIGSPQKPDSEETAVSPELKKNVHLYKCCHA